MMLYIKVLLALKHWHTGINRQSYTFGMWQHKLHDIEEGYFNLSIIKKTCGVIWYISARILLEHPPPLLCKTVWLWAQDTPHIPPSWRDIWCLLLAYRKTGKTAQTCLNSSDNTIFDGFAVHCVANVLLCKKSPVTPIRHVDNYMMRETDTNI